MILPDGDSRRQKFLKKGNILLWSSSGSSGSAAPSWGGFPFRERE